MNDFKPYSFTDAGIHERIHAVLSKKMPVGERRNALRFLLSAIDLTTLEATDTDAKVASLCEQAKSFAARKDGLPNVAAVCVYPPFASLVSDQLKGSGIRTACVATAFPSGQTTLAVKIMEVSYVVAEGADEVDMVISRGKFLEGKYDEVTAEIMKVKENCGDALLKVILETGELSTISNIRKACEIALSSGADFLKTSTGKTQPAATPEAFLIMLDSIKEYFNMTGKRVGIKAAGGIADAETALKYYMLARAVLGPEWLNKRYFRIGASRLAENIFIEL
ncbi:MAG: deoxyribose-phosphate aldolase [Bacteroidales bacterium]|nr:deoxyribose-phosphate aldolase [Bacteroidales bacterium]